MEGFCTTRPDDEFLHFVRVYHGPSEAGTMKRLATFLLAVFLGLWAVAAMAQTPPKLGPGGVWVHGFVNDFGQFQLDMGIQQGTQKPFKILAVKVYSMPSNTLLAAVVDPEAPESVLKSILREQPEAMASGVIGKLSPSFGLKGPPAKDKSIRVDYVVEKGKGISYRPLARVYASDMQNFEFSAVPMNGGGIKMCAYCYGELCGCVACQGGALYVCCDLCTVSCYPIVCQGI